MSFVGRAAGNAIRFAYGASFSSIIMTSEAASVYATNGIWYHIAVTRSSDTYRLFVNGVLVATVVSSDTYPATARYAAVGNNYGSTSGLDGYVDEVRVTKVGDRVILEPLKQQTASEKAEKRAEALKRLEQRKWSASEGYKFDRDEANER